MPSRTQSTLAFVATIGIASFLFWSYRRKDRSCRRNTESPIFLSKQDLATLSQDELIQIFYECARLASQLEHLRNGDKLMLYGLYKQATAGNCTALTPSRMQLVAHAKHSAWSRFRGMTKSLAMRYYVEAIQDFFQDDHPALDDNGDDEDEDDYMVDVTSMGLRPSMPQQEQEKDEVHESELSWNDRMVRASSRDDWKGLRVALENGADVTATDESGQSCLHFAADRGEADIVQLLLDHGADPNASDHEGISVLQAAVIAGHVEVTRILLQAGADPDQQDMDGDSAKSCATDDGSKAMKLLFMIGEQ